MLNICFPAVNEPIKKECKVKNGMTLASVIGPITNEIMATVTIAYDHTF